MKSHQPTLCRTIAAQSQLRKSSTFALEVATIYVETIGPPSYKNFTWCSQVSSVFTSSFCSWHLKWWRFRLLANGHCFFQTSQCQIHSSQYPNQTHEGHDVEVHGRVTAGGGLKTAVTVTALQNDSNNSHRKRCASDHWNFNSGDIWCL